ncbi:hypothetical protein QYE76_070449 [Lolium multiflorum]|uniref:Uncharacterized protein n=1 Tax=Lolium multiflorum TaxID=4521 RepID=A0AAD8SJ94_LOLMU|nr:hypothetical protein QYE76_070449 [Lolium multiflorum]
MRFTTVNPSAPQLRPHHSRTVSGLARLDFYSTRSIVPGFSLFLIELMCKRLGPRVVWVSRNFPVCIAMASTSIILVVYQGIP